MYRSTSSTINLKVAVEVSPLVAKPATHQVEAVLVLPAWLQIIIGVKTLMENVIKATCPGPQSAQRMSRPVGNQDH